jgi:NAD(P)-dependent dehydrogenase (short-subunit alcohol dehydrogenase family)
MTDVAKAWSQERQQSAGLCTPMGRPGHPDDYVGPALWLASDASAFVTADVIRVDGGAYRQMP